jgi:quercetin dioxygenase-like cupin family protein
MSGHVLRVTRDQLAAGGRYATPLAAMNRVLYVLDGDVTVEAGARAPVATNAAWHGAGPCAAVAGSKGATVLRYELVRAGTPPAPAAGAVSTALLEHPIQLDPSAKYLMRCDRVDFDLGAEALPHRHKGGGIRCLISGTMELRVEGEPDRVIQPGQAWFESGREPVYAKASASEATSFIRCSILPREIRGQSSIMYVDPKDAGSKPRRYTVFLDEPIELP